MKYFSGSITNQVRSQYGDGSGIDANTDRHAVYGKRKDQPGGWNPSLTMGPQTRKEPTPHGTGKGKG